MRKKSFAGLLVVFLVIGLVIYWWQRQDEDSGPTIAALPPAQALAFVVAPGWPQAWKDLRRTKYVQQMSSPTFWQATLGEDGYHRFVEAKQQIEQRLGFPITEQTVDQVLDREFAVTLVPRQQGPWPLT
jgi:hypothetical protein